jgi:hypothetical protein
VAPVTAAPELGAGALQLGATDTTQCDNASTDAASCSTGGWVFDPNLGCCFLGARGTLGKWRHGTQVKCCGACAGL